MVTTCGIGSVEQRIEAGCDIGEGLASRWVNADEGAIGRQSAIGHLLKNAHGAGIEVADNRSNLSAIVAPIRQFKEIKHCEVLAVSSQKMEYGRVCWLSPDEKRDRPRCGDEVHRVRFSACLAPWR